MQGRNLEASSSGEMSGKTDTSDELDDDQSIAIPEFIVLEHGERIKTVSARKFFRDYAKRSIVPTEKLAIIICSGIKDTICRSSGCTSDLREDEFLYGGSDYSSRMQFASSEAARWLVCLYNMSLHDRPDNADGDPLWTLLSAGRTRKYPYFRVLLYWGLEHARWRGRMLWVSKQDEQQLLTLLQKYGCPAYQSMESAITLFNTPLERHEEPYNSARAMPVAELRPSSYAALQDADTEPEDEDVELA